MYCVGFEITALGPLVPAVDVHDLVFLGEFQEFFRNDPHGVSEPFRRISGNDARIGIGKTLVPVPDFGLHRAGGGIPAHGNIGEIFDPELFEHLFPVFQIPGKDRIERRHVFREGGMVFPYVAGDAVESQKCQKFGKIAG